MKLKIQHIAGLLFLALVFAAGCSQTGDPESILTTTSAIDFNEPSQELNQFSSDRYVEREMNGKTYYFPIVKSSAEIVNNSDAAISFEIMPKDPPEPQVTPLSGMVPPLRSQKYEFVWVDSSLGLVGYSKNYNREYFLSDGRSGRVRLLNYAVVPDILPGEGAERFKFGEQLRYAMENLVGDTTQTLTARNNEDPADPNHAFIYGSITFTTGMEAGIEFVVKDSPVTVRYEEEDTGIVREVQWNGNDKIDPYDTITMIKFRSPYTPEKGKRGILAGNLQIGSTRADVENIFEASADGSYPQRGVDFTYNNDGEVTEIEVYPVE